MFPPFPNRVRQGRLLGEALRAIRRRRGLAVKQTARAMGMSLSAYERFEAGGGEIRLERLFRFAQVTNSDPFGLVAQIYFGEPGLAERCADHKPLLINALALQRFDAAEPETLPQLDVVTLIDAYSRAYDGLAAVARQRRALAQAWLAGPADEAATPPVEAPEADGDG